MRRILPVILSVAALIGVAVVFSQAHDTWHDHGHDFDKVRIGLQITPVRLNLRGRDIYKVGLGSYIINAQGGCVDCHSCPTYSAGHNPYAGQPKQFNPTNYLAGGTPFGPIISANLTPDDTGKPGGMSWHQFRNAIRHGQDPEEPGRLLQVMPWPTYQSMTDHDIYAMYEYLRAIPSAQPGGCSGSGQAGQ